MISVCQQSRPSCGRSLRRQNDGDLADRDSHIRQCRGNWSCSSPRREREPIVVSRRDDLIFHSAPMKTKSMLGTILLIILIIALLGGFRDRGRGLFYGTGCYGCRPLVPHARNNPT
jgi:hypothetical protein